MLLFGCVLQRWAPLQMYSFGTAKGPNGPRATSKMMKWVTSRIILLIVPCLWGRGGVYTGFVATTFGGCFERGKQSGRSEWTRHKKGEGTPKGKGPQRGSCSTSEQRDSCLTLAHQTSVSLLSASQAMLSQTPPPCVHPDISTGTRAEPLWHPCPPLLECQP